MKAFSRRLPRMGKSHFVRFAAVVGDFNPIHYDLEHARKAGLPAVISQGPLTYTLALDAIASEVGLDAVAGFEARITAPVFPEAELEASCVADGAVTVGDGDKTVLTGTVTPR